MKRPFDSFSSIYYQAVAGLYSRTYGRYISFYMQPVSKGLFGLLAAGAAMWFLFFGNQSLAVRVFISLAALPLIRWVGLYLFILWAKLAKIIAKLMIRLLCYVLANLVFDIAWIHDTAGDLKSKTISNAIHKGKGLSYLYYVAAYTGRITPILEKTIPWLVTAAVISATLIYCLQGMWYFWQAFSDKPIVHQISLLLIPGLFYAACQFSVLTIVIGLLAYLALALATLTGLAVCSFMAACVYLWDSVVFALTLLVRAVASGVLVFFGLPRLQVYPALSSRQKPASLKIVKEIISNTKKTLHDIDTRIGPVVNDLKIVWPPLSKQFSDSIDPNRVSSLTIQLAHAKCDQAVKDAEKDLFKLTAALTAWKSIKPLLDSVINNQRTVGKSDVEIETLKKELRMTISEPMKDRLLRREWFENRKILKGLPDIINSLCPFHWAADTLNFKSLRDVTPQTLDSHFRHRSLKVHPDKNPGDKNAQSKLDNVVKARDYLRIYLKHKGAAA